uniref:Uncharacterized protein n=1 Tax=Candidatus Methanogaster sp. ANME-2c ERB4 TaxID=2759911 RepID=A0A7G9YDR4_9EURY|nr:hypothetical protein MFHEKKGA_00042 [Methanosarcinales archaeon ANME-2c ERB4]
MILEADVVCVTEGSIHTTVSPIFGTSRGGMSPAGSQTVAWYQMEIMGTREAQYAPLIPHKGKGVCAIKPINGKIPQMAYWESQIKKRAITRPFSSQNGT